MSLTIALTASVLCAIVYILMYRWEVPEPMEFKKAVVPPVVGFFTPVLSTLLLVGIGLLLKTMLGGSLKELIPSLLPRSLVSAFLLAGFTEEIVKFLLFLIIIKFLKPKNVYEYGMLCAGIGFGFTALEEILYGGNNIVIATMRMPFFAMHMLFGLIMGIFLGLAAYSKKDGWNDSGKYTFLALFLPVLWHTLFDAATTTNAALSEGDHHTRMMGGAIAIVMLVISIILQFVLLYLFRKKRNRLCSMDLTETEPEAAAEEEDIFAFPELADLKKKWEEQNDKTV